MVFWNTSSASPSVVDALSLWPLAPRFLRTAVPQRPSEGRPVRRATPYDGADVCAFWRAYYGGDDWILDATVDWVRLYIDDPLVYVLIMTDTLFGIIATIVSTPITRGLTRMSHGASLPNVRCIEGLCIHPSQRGQGLAGVMIASMDWYTARFEPTVHLWSRELATRPLFLNTALEISTYAYIECVKARRRMDVQSIQWDDFLKFWDGVAVGAPSIMTTIPMRRRDDLFVWAYDDTVAVITRTRRLTKIGGLAIYEVVWTNTQDAVFLESVAAEYDGIMFATGALGAPWVYGRSGYHAWYMYNYMPPAFGSCELHIVREEI